MKSFSSYALESSKELFSLENIYLLWNFYEKSSNPDLKELIFEGLFLISQGNEKSNILIHYILFFEFFFCEQKTLLRRNTLATKVFERMVKKFGNPYISRILLEPVLLLTKNDALPENILLDENEIKSSFLENKIGKDQSSNRNNINSSNNVSLLKKSQSRESLDKSFMKSKITSIFKKTNSISKEDYDKNFSQKIKNNDDSEDEIMNPERKVRAILLQNKLKLSQYLQVFCDFIFSKDSSSILPPIFKIYFLKISHLSKSLNLDPLPYVGSMIFLRFINSGVLFPEKCQLVTSPIKDSQRNILKLIAKCLQDLSNQKRSKESMMAILEKELNLLQSKCNHFLLRISQSDKKDETTDISLFTSDKKTIDSLIESKFQKLEKNIKEKKIHKRVFSSTPKSNPIIFDEICNNNNDLISEVTMAIFGILNSNELGNEIGIKKEEPKDEGKVAFASLIKSENSKIGYHITFCDERHYQSENDITEFIEEIFHFLMNEKEKKYENGSLMSFSDMKFCLDRSFILCSMPFDNYFFFIASEYPFSKLLCKQFLTETHLRWLKLSNKDYKETSACLEEMISEYNKGEILSSSFLKELLAKVVKINDEQREESINYKGKDDGFESTRLEKLRIADDGKSILFKEIPPFNELFFNLQ